MRLIEHYLSIQGEGLHPGKLTYFVRFARCNLRCSWCDSTYTFGEGTETPFETVSEAIEKSHAQFVCLTGGEPLLYPRDCLRLIHYFPQLHFDIETGGSIPIQEVLFPNVSLIMDWKLAHSGMSHQMKEQNLSLLRPQQDLLKFVTDGSDEELSEMENLIRYTEPFHLLISVQPVFGTDARKLAEWLIQCKNPRLQLNLQIHKIIWGKEMARV